MGLIAFADVNQAAPEGKLGSIQVTNGGSDGDWGLFQLCPTGTLAEGFSLRRDFAGSFDETAINGIQLHCVDGVTTNETLITSSYAE